MSAETAWDELTLSAAEYRRAGARYRQQRNVRAYLFVVPYLVMVWFFVTPIVYGVTAVKPSTQSLLALNPMAGVIDGFRWSVLGRGLPHYHVYALSFGIALAVMLSGLWYFRRVERYFADLI